MNGGVSATLDESKRQLSLYVMSLAARNTGNDDQLDQWVPHGDVQANVINGSSIRAENTFAMSNQAGTTQLALTAKHDQYFYLRFRAAFGNGIALRHLAEIICEVRACLICPDWKIKPHEKAFAPTDGMEQLGLFRYIGD